MGDISTVSRGSEVNFAFALNDSDFSDRILRLEIDDDNETTDSGKKLTPEKYNEWFSSIQSKDSESSDGPFNKKRKKSSDGVKVTSLNICSLVLAEKSPFFHKMFTNGMRESQQKNEVCLKIKASEEANLIDLIRFMYGETALNATSFHDLVDLLIAADKFEVTSCMSLCVEKLHKFPMSLEHALFYLELPSSVLVSKIVKPLIRAAKKHVLNRYKDFTKSQDEAMQLPLSALEVVLGSKGLEVESEDLTFDFILRWARASYPNLEERREILTKRLAPLICFSDMSVPKLKEVLTCIDYDFEHVSKLVHEALFSKVDRSCGQLIRETNVLSTTEYPSSAGRVYRPHCVVFFDLTKQECVNLFTHRIETPQFRLGGKMISLLACYVPERFGVAEKFGLYVTASETCRADFEIAVMRKSSRQFESKLKVNNHNLDVHGYRCTPNLLNITYTELASDDCDYFISGVLRLRVELTLKSS